MMVYFLIGIYFWLWPAPETLHDIHMSKTEVFYNQENQSLEVSMHLFIDDLEDAITSYGVDPLYLETAKESDSSSAFIKEYVERFFKIRVDGKDVAFDFIGKEADYDLIAVWCYFEGKGVDINSEVEVENRLLLDLYQDQKNVVTFIANKLRRFYLLDSDLDSVKIAL